MKIVIGTHGFLPSIGGVSTNVSILARAFVEMGHDVTVVSLNAGPETGYGHRVYRRPGPLTLFRLYRDADLLILSNLAMKLIYPLFIAPRKFALRHHSESAFRLSRSFFSPDFLRRLVLPMATHFMTSDYVGRKSGFSRYAVTSPFSNPHHITPAVIRAPAERTGALFVGRLEPEKGVDWLLQRWELVRSSLGVDELRIVGQGSLSAAVADKIAAGLLPGVVLLGPLQRDRVAQEMGRARYLLVPSLWEEPFGAVALEGVAAGDICIVSRRGGLVEAGGPLAQYFDPDDDASFGNALADARSTFERHLASPDEREKYETEVRRHVAKFEPKKVALVILKEMFGE